MNPKTTQPIELRGITDSRHRRWVFPAAEVLDLTQAGREDDHGTYVITVRAHLDEDAVWLYEYLDEKEA